MLQLMIPAMLLLTTQTIIPIMIPTIIRPRIRWVMIFTCHSSSIPSLAEWHHLRIWRQRVIQDTSWHFRPWPIREFKIVMPGQFGTLGMGCYTLFSRSGATLSFKDRDTSCRVAECQIIYTEKTPLDTYLRFFVDHDHDDDIQQEWSSGATYDPNYSGEIQVKL